MRIEFNAREIVKLFQLVSSCVPSTPAEKVLIENLISKVSKLITSILEEAEDRLDEEKLRAWLDTQEMKISAFKGEKEKCKNICNSCGVKDK
jgi:hypothetical protein